MVDRKRNVCNILDQIVRSEQEEITLLDQAIGLIPPGNEENIDTLEDMRADESFEIEKLRRIQADLGCISPRRTALFG